MSGAVTPAAGVDTRSLVHALEVHQAELEAQNQELASTIAALRRSHAAVAAAHDRYRALYDLAPAPLLTIDPDGTLVELNAAGAALLGDTRERLIGRRLALFVDEDTRPALRALLRDLFAQGALRGAALVLRRAGGPPIDVQIDAVAGHELDEPTDRAVLACVDVTAQRRALERQRLESLGVLAGGVAHDFNNLLTVVLAGADHALRTIGADAPASASLVEVAQAARMAGELAHQMLAYSGRISAPPRAIELGGMVRSLELLMRASAGSTAVTLDLAPELPAVRGDETQLRQIVLNLVLNAAEAMRGRAGAITVAARAQRISAAVIEQIAYAGELAPGPCVVLEVRDRGAGMDASTQARIFEPYFSTKSIGRGLGLATVQGIVRAHHGAITVESVIGAGTTFRVYLPAIETAPVRASSPSPQWRVTGTVLLVDDEEFVRRAMSRILGDLGMAVVLAVDGLAAVDVFRTEGHRFDLVLMDLTMPRLGGVAAARAIRELRADVPIVLVTGYGEIPADAGDVFTGVLAKPFDIAGIRRVLEQLLPAHRATPR